MEIFMTLFVNAIFNAHFIMGIFITYSGASVS